jgi:hypothetical protein
MTEAEEKQNVLSSGDTSRPTNVLSQYRNMSGICSLEWRIRNHGLNKSGDTNRTGWTGHG